MKTYKMEQKMNKKAFTLAESVLPITVIAIIIIVVATTVADVCAGKKYDEALFKKVYNEMYLSAHQKMLKEGEATFRFSSDTPALRADIVEYMKVDKYWKGCDNKKIVGVLTDQNQCNDVKGITLLNGAKVSFIGNDGNLRTKLNKINKRVNNGNLVGVAVITGKSKTLDNQSIIPIYDTGIPEIMESDMINEPEAIPVKP